MNRLRRALAQFLLPSTEYDLLTDTYRVPVTAELLGALGEWSDPVQVKLERRGPDGFLLVVRTAAPMPRLNEGSGLWAVEVDQKAVDEALARGECPDCGQPLTAPGAPGICAAGHNPPDATEAARAEFRNTYRPEMAEADKVELWCRFCPILVDPACVAPAEDA